MTDAAEVVEHKPEKERPANPDVLNLMNQKLTRIELPDSETAVSTLLLDNNMLTKLENLDALGQSLRQLSVADNQLRRIVNLNRLENLTVLNLARNKLTRIDGLRTLSKLTWLNLSENEIQTIENLDGNTELKHLDLSSNSIRALGNLTSCRKLKTVLLHTNVIRTLKNAASLLPRGITILSLAENELSDLNDVAFLHSFGGLEQLSLTDNPCCEQPQLFAIPKQPVSARQSVSPGASENESDYEEMEIEFDYRPFVLNWCMKLQILDAQLVSDKECLKAEWLWSQGRGRHFAAGEHFELCSYLSKHCPLRPTSAEEDSKLNRILSKRQQYRQVGGQEAPVNESRESKRPLERSGELSEAHSVARTTPRASEGNTERRQPPTQAQLASESVYIPVQAGSRGTQPASRSPTPSSEQQSPLHGPAPAASQPGRLSQPSSSGNSLSLANRPSAYLPVNVTRAQSGSHVLLQLSHPAALSAQVASKSESDAARKENIDPLKHALQRDAPATLVTEQRTITRESDSRSVSVATNSSTVTHTRPQTTQTSTGSSEGGSNVAVMRCIQALFTETNKQIEFVREATKAQQLTLTLLTALIADVSELKARRDTSPQSTLAAHPAKQDLDTRKDDTTFVLLREDETHVVTVLHADEYLRVTWPECHDATVTADSSDPIVGYQLLLDEQPLLLAYGRQRCTATLDAAVLQLDQVHTLTVHRVARSAPPVALFSPLRFVLLLRTSLKQRFADDESVARASLFSQLTADSDLASHVTDSNANANASLCNTLSDASVSTAFATLGTVYRAQLAASEHRHREDDTDEQTESAPVQSADSVHSSPQRPVAGSHNASAEGLKDERLRHGSAGESDSITSVTELNAQADSASPNEDDDGAFSEEAPVTTDNANENSHKDHDTADEDDPEDEDDQAMSTIKQAPV